MTLLALTIFILFLFVYFKIKKLKELNIELLKKETALIVFYEQRFELFLQIISSDLINIQESIFMDISELRKNALLVKKQEDNRLYFVLEEKIQSIFKKHNLSQDYEFISDDLKIMDLNNQISNINASIEETKNQYNIFVDDLNQEKNDFFGKRIFKYIKDIKKYYHI